MNISHESIREIVGTDDYNMLAAIIATGANLKEIIEAKALADNKTDIVGQGESAPQGPIMAVYVILTNKQPQVKRGLDFA